MADLLVIGGGAIGLLTARELRLAGAEVTVLERGEPARESSWAGGGIVSPLYPWRYADAVTALAGWSQTRYPGLCDELHAATGIDPELEPSGLLIEAAAETAAAQAWAAARGVRLETGKQAEAINTIYQFLVDTITDEDMPEIERMKVLVGHTPLQVLIGSILGIGVGFWLG